MSKQCAPQRQGPLSPLGRQEPVPAAGAAPYLWASRVLACVVIVAIHLGILEIAERSAPLFVAVAVYLVPSAVTVVCRRQARLHWWRFVVLLAVNFVATSGTTLAVFFVAETWVLHRSWVVESDPADLLLLSRIRRWCATRIPAVRVTDRHESSPCTRKDQLKSHPHSHAPREPLKGRRG